MRSLQAFALYGYRCLALLVCASDNEQGATLPNLVNAVGVAVAVLDIGIAETDKRGRTADAGRQFVGGKGIECALGICQLDGDKSKILTVGLERCAVGCQADSLGFASSL